MDRNKKIIVIASGLLILILVILLILLKSNLKKASVNQAAGTSDPTQAANLPTPQFLNAAEKASLGLPDATKAQIIQQDANGNVIVYKIIQTDQDIVADPTAIRPLSPQAAATSTR
jgi:hypothetical protein